MGKFCSVRHHGYSGFWVLGPTPTAAAAAKGRRRGRRGEGEKGAGYSSNTRRGGVGAAVGGGRRAARRRAVDKGVFVVRGSWFVVSCVHCTSYVRLRAFFFLYLLSFFSFFLFFFFSFSGQGVVPCFILPSPPVSRLPSLNARDLWLARSRNTPIWSSNRLWHTGLLSSRHKTTQREKRHRERTCLVSRHL